MADAAAMKEWAKGGAEEEEAPPPNPEKEDMAEKEEVGDQEEEGDERMSLLIELIKEFRPQIEESVASMDPEVLLNVEEELPEDVANGLVESLGQMGELPDMLDNIDEKTAIAATNMIEEELENTEPMVFAAWLYRAGELV